MSREYTLYTSLVQIEKGNRNDLLKALEDLSNFDLDFNGDNGIDYAWEETIESGFESNLEYVIDNVKDIKIIKNIEREQNYISKEDLAELKKLEELDKKDKKNAQ